MKKEKSKLAKILLPKATSFLPIGLGINTSRYSKEERINSNSNISEKNLKKESLFTGIACECIRDIPTLSLIYTGSPEGALVYYTLVSYISDRI